MFWYCTCDSPGIIIIFDLVSSYLCFLSRIRVKLWRRRWLILRIWSFWLIWGCLALLLLLEHTLGRSVKVGRLQLMKFWMAIALWFKVEYCRRFHGRAIWYWLWLKARMLAQICLFYCLISMFRSSEILLIWPEMLL